MTKPRSAFSATQWSVVLAAGGEGSKAATALSRLCDGYWYPLYAFARRMGAGPEDAEDAVQGFFADLLGRKGLARVERERGRFRSFLLAAFKNFQSREREKANAGKRGAGRHVLHLDAAHAEGIYASEPVDNVSPDTLFDRRWAELLLARAQERLRAEYEAVGKAGLFEALRSCLGGKSERIGYEGIGAKLGLSEGAVKIAVHRLRERFRAVLRAEVGETVASPDEIDSELRHLIAVL